jgi:hypothetical protein
MTHLQPFSHSAIQPSINLTDIKTAGKNIVYLYIIVSVVIISRNCIIGAWGSVVVKALRY